MKVQVLGIYGYRGRLDYEWGESFSDPTFADIEIALRRLDACEFAGVVLHQNDYREGEPATDALHVAGGPEGYLVTCMIPGRGAIAIVNRDRPASEKRVRVCQRDQGVWVPERKVCRDLQVVLGVARHYADTGLLWPAVHWE